MSKRASLIQKKPRRNKSSFMNEDVYDSVPRHGILKNNISQENFANHTISSAIKSDYTLQDVKYKLEELNSSVKKTKIVKTAPSVKVAKVCQRSDSSKPFVVRKVSLLIQPQCF